MSNRKREYENAILIFALIQVVIAMLQFAFSSIETTNIGARWFGGVSMFSLGILLWWLVKKATSK